MDPRLKWIRERILSYLGFDNVDLFNNMMDYNDGELNEKMSNFINEPIDGMENNMEKIVFHIHRTYYDKMVEVEKEITEWRIIPPSVKLMSPPQSSKKKGKSKTKPKKEGESHEKEPETIVDDRDAKSPEKLIIDQPKVTFEDENVPGRETAAAKVTILNEVDEDRILPSSKPPILDPEVDGTIEYYTLKRFVPMMMRLPKFNGGFGSIDLDETKRKTKFVYVIRLTESPIPIPESDDESNVILPEHFVFGSCNGNLILSMTQVLNQSYKEILDYDYIKFQERAADNVGVEKLFYSVAHNYQISKIIADQSSEDAGNVQRLDNDDIFKLQSNISTCKSTLDNTMSLISSAQWAQEHIEYDVQLPMPTAAAIFDKNTPIATLAQTKEIIDSLDKIIKSWKTYCSNKFDVNLIKNFTADDPVAEYEFWKKRYFDLLKLKEQLGTSQAQRIISILNETESRSVKIIDDINQSVLKHYKQSKNNVNALTNLLRYFKIVTECTDLDVIDKTVPGLMNGLNMLWILSSFYCSSENMMLLLERISNCLCKKIESHLAPKTLFLKPLVKIKLLAIDGKNMMENWRACYMKTRRDIEESGRYPRWEFDERRLFHRINYLANICEDLSKISQILMEFRNVLSDHFKSIIANPIEIDKLSENVNQLIYPIQSIDFNLFIPDNKENWDVIMNDFNRELKLVEEKVMQFINASFESLRSSEDAMQVLLKFVDSSTRECVKNQLPAKFECVLNQFTAEISEIKDVFNVHRNNPNLLRNHPSVSGSILFVRLLYEKLTKINAIYSNIEYLTDYKTESESYRNYVALGIEMKNYEENSYENWIKNALPVIKNAMMNKILKSDNQRKMSRLKPITNAKPRKHSLSKQLNGKNKIELKELGVVFSVNFISEFFQIVEEAELMEYLGFSLPSQIRNYSMLRDTIHKDLYIFKHIIGDYFKLKKSLSKSETDLLEKHLYHIEKCFIPGIERIIWTSLGTEKFITKCKKELDHLTLFHKQIVLINKEIQSKIDEIVGFNLFQLNESFCHPFGAYFKRLEIIQDAKIDQMKCIYETTGPILIKLENLVLATNTGESPNMIETYNHWEKAIFHAFINICVCNIKKFNEILEDNVPLFEVDAVLSVVDVNLHPPPEEICKIIKQSVDNFLLKLSSFPRWIRGTCKVCNMQIIEKSGEIFMHTFYNDLNNVNVIKRHQNSLYSTIEKIVLNAHIYVQKWLKYKALWLYDKLSACERFVQNCTEIVRFDNKFSFFSGIIADLNEHEKSVNVGSLKINVNPIIAQIKKHTAEWQETLGKCLIRSTKEKMNDLESLIKKQHINLNVNIKTLNDFKLVMLTINQIKKITIAIEVKYTSMQEIFKMLKSHKIAVDDDDFKFAQSLEMDWKKLYTTSLFQMDKLVNVKARFSAIVLDEVNGFLSKVNEFTGKYYNEGPGVITDDLDQGLRLMKDYGNMFTAIESQRKALSNDEQLFENPLADYTEFVQAKLDFECLQSIYDIYRRKKKSLEDWSSLKWTSVDLITLDNDIDAYLIKFKELPEWIKEKPCGEALLSKMVQFKTAIPLMMSLRNEALNMRHWNDLIINTGHDFTVDLAELTMGTMFGLKLYDYPEIVENIVNCAIKEAAIEREIKEIENIWQCLTFDLIKIDADSVILNSCDRIIGIIEEHTMKLQNLENSQFVGPFLLVVLKWEKDLSVIAEVIDEWLNTQQKLLYLQGIFVGTDIREQLPEEADNFDQIMANFKAIMSDTVTKLNVLECCLITGRYDEIMGIYNGLEECQKSLINFLDLKREQFPRFYFFSNDELLSLVGNNDPRSVQNFITKFFDNINELTLHEDDKSYFATGMKSYEDEILKFTKNVSLNGGIEHWMNFIIEEMRSSNKTMTKQAIFHYGMQKYTSRNEWIDDNLASICITVNNIWWTAKTEDAFAKLKQGRKTAMKDLLNELNAQLTHTIAKIRTGVNRNDLKKYKSIITNDVHARDVVEGFVVHHITNIEQFEWEKQLRFYWIKNMDDIQIQQCSGRFNYGYEYTGMNDRLVITPLTDRIYLALTQALNIHLGSALSGPAGTGKTETVKDLAKCFALLCIITNCSEGVDFHAMQQIFLGLCPSGAWGCFDEFNRINIMILSVIASQIEAICNALTAGNSQMILGDKVTTIDGKFGLFITMNPGYTGRTELPESLKTLFRPVVCIEPDAEIICQILMYSDGFIEAKVIARKICTLFNLAKQQLSRQSHYDWNLRALIALLRMSGYLRHSNCDLSENIIIMKALQDVTIPKLVYDDVNLFTGLIKDLFPGLEIPKIKQSALNTAIDDVLKMNGLVSIPAQNEKIMQLNEITSIMHCVMLVGPSGGGKTTIIQTLVDSQSYLNIPTKLVTLNPKSCSVIELYGVLDPITRDWMDGLFSCIFRRMNTTKEDNQKGYILFDGDVDPIWIENINSVMDDNKLLTLANGERIRLAPNSYLLFELGDLHHASPATVSRAGMIYVDTTIFTYVHYWQRWLNSRSTTERKTFNELFKSSVPDCLKLTSSLKLTIERSPLNMITQLTIIIDGLIPVLNSTDEQYDEEIIKTSFIIAMYYSIGAVLSEESRIAFDEFIKKKYSISVDDDIQNKAKFGSLPRMFPTLFDYHPNFDDRCWEAWDWLVPKYVHDRSSSIFDILVPTVETVRLDWLLNIIRKANRPFLLIGDSGSSKTSIITYHLNQQDLDKHIISKMNFSWKTSSLDFQNTIERHLEKRTKLTYGPPLGKKLILFIDDLNSPQVDDYGTRQPLALLKLLLERSGVYGRGRDLNWKQFCDVEYVGIMNNIVGSKNHVDPRCLSKFCVYNLTYPSNNVLKQIYHSILKGHLDVFGPNIQELAGIIINMTLELFTISLKEFLPTPSKFHYVFNLRDLSRILCGLKMTEPNLYPEPKYIIRVWRNEFTRVFCDRFTHREDLMSMQDHIANVIANHFDEASERDDTERLNNENESNQGVTPITPVHTSDSDVLTDAGAGEASDDGIDEEELELDRIKELSLQEYILRDPLLYGDFRNALNKEVRSYEDLLDYDAVYYLFQEILEEYNESIERMSLILFEEFLEHLTRVHRVLRIERNHLLLIGDDSNGKQSVVKLAAFAAGNNVFQIDTFEGYGLTDFKNDLKDLYRMLGVQNQKTALMLRSNQITDDNFLELINDMLISGMVPNLFSTKEKNDIIKLMLQNDSDIISEDHDYTDVIWEKFCRNCFVNLHVVITAPPGDVLRRQCRNFPVLIKYTTVNWMFSWPREALLAIGNIYLAEMAHIPEQFREPIIQHVVYVDSTVKKYSVQFLQQLKRYNCVTPKHYINYLTYYTKLLDSKIKSNNAEVIRLEEGLLKIEEANIELYNLNTKLNVQKTAMNEQANECDRISTEILSVTEELGEIRKTLETERSEVEHQEKLFSVEKKKADDALSSVLPGLKSSKSILENLDKSAISEIRSLPSPPESLQIVIECFLILKGAKEISWKSAKSMMNDPNFIFQILNLNYDEITQNQINSVQKHLKSSDKLDEIESVNKAGNDLYNYLQAVLKYWEVFREAKPQLNKAANLEEDYQKVVENLESLNKREIEVDLQLKQLNESYNTAVVLHGELQTSIASMITRLATAERLMSGLSSENNRWKEDLKQSLARKSKLMGDCLIIAGFLSYLGPFTLEYRNQMLHQDWVTDVQQRNIPISLPFNLQVCITNRIEIDRWNFETLPYDEFSIQNGILVTYSHNFPICIDPQDLATDWIKKKEEKNNLKIINFFDCDHLKQIKLAIEDGYPILICNVDIDINPAVEKLLSNEVILKGTKQYIKFGNKEFEYNENFRLYLTTKLLNPRFNTTTYNKGVIVNFTMTLKSMEEQLLTILINCKLPELEEQRTVLFRKKCENTVNSTELEQTMLNDLSKLSGNILDNDELISTLENTKIKVAEVEQEIQSTEETRESIDNRRNSYRPLAKRGTILFSTLNDLSTVNVMYQYSFSTFTNVFIKSLCEESDQTLDSDEQIVSSIDKLTEDFYQYGCTGLFDRHKILFSLQITLSLEKYKESISQDQINFFMSGFKSSDDNQTPCSVSWVDPEIWGNICGLSRDFSKSFGTLCESITEKSDDWLKWFENDNPELIDFPDDYSANLNDFEALMLLRCFRIDRISSAINKYIINIMGKKFVTPPLFSMENIYRQTNSKTMVIFILTPSSDTKNILKEFLKRCKFNDHKLKIIPFGQRQEQNILRSLEYALIEGQWLVLQNCHLQPGLLNTIDKLLQQSSPHSEFRLWLTTEATPYFPITILQKGIKVITEAPKSLKFNLRNKYAKLDDDTLNSCDHPQFKNILYTLVFFNAIIQERQKYGKVGWNIVYNFNHSDFLVCVKMLAYYLDKSARSDKIIPWTTIKYLIGEVIYGGHIIDNFDRRIMNTYIEEYFGDYLFYDFTGFKFYKNESLEYEIAPDSTKIEYIGFIDNLPTFESPEVLGLHTNAEIEYNSQFIKDMWNNLLEMQTERDATSVDQSREEMVNSVADGILDKIPPMFNIVKIKKQFEMSVSPTFIVLLQELERINNLMRTMSDSLNAVKRALIGEIELDPALEDLSNSLYAGRLPSAWKLLTPETLKSLGDWTDHFSRRIKQYTLWATKEEPLVMWLSGLHVPEAYMMAHIQIACHQYTRSLDECTQYTLVTSFNNIDEIEERPQIGCYVHGLYLEGATWSNTENCLKECHSRILTTELPVISIIPIETIKLHLQNVLPTPVYVTSARKDAMGRGLVFESQLNTKIHNSKWILRGVCVIMNTN